MTEWKFLIFSYLRSCLRLFCAFSMALYNTSDICFFRPSSLYIQLAKLLLRVLLISVIKQNAGVRKEKMEKPRNASSRYFCCVHWREYSISIFIIHVLHCFNWYFIAKRNISPKEFKGGYLITFQ